MQSGCHINIICFATCTYTGSTQNIYSTVRVIKQERNKKNTNKNKVKETKNKTKNKAETNKQTRKKKRNTRNDTSISSVN